MRINDSYPTPAVMPDHVVPVSPEQMNAFSERLQRISEIVADMRGENGPNATNRRREEIYRSAELPSVPKSVTQPGTQPPEEQFIFVPRGYTQVRRNLVYNHGPRSFRERVIMFSSPSGDLLMDGDQPCAINAALYDCGIETKLYKPRTDMIIRTVPWVGAGTSNNGYIGNRTVVETNLPVTLGFEGALTAAGDSVARSTLMKAAEYRCRIRALQSNRRLSRYPNDTLPELMSNYRRFGGQELK
jgi:hypothetical protein